MPASKPAEVDLYSFSPLSFGSTVLSEKSKRLIVKFPLTYVVFSGDYNFQDKRFVSVKCTEPYTILNTEHPFDSIDQVSAFLLYQKVDLLQHFAKNTLASLKKLGLK